MYMPKTEKELMIQLSEIANEALTNKSFGFKADVTSDYMKKIETALRSLTGGNSLPEGWCGDDEEQQAVGSGLNLKEIDHDSESDEFKWVEDFMRNEEEPGGEEGLLHVLSSIANDLDKRGLTKEADSLDKILASMGPMDEGSNRSTLSPISYEIGQKIIELLESDAGKEVLGKLNITLDDRLIEVLSAALEAFKPEALAERISVMALSAGNLEAVEASQFTRALEKTGSLDAKFMGKFFDFAKTTVHQMIATVKYLIGPAKIWKKTVVAGITAAVGTGYLASPIDLIPDVLLGVGQVDDIIMYFKIFAYTAAKLDPENWMIAMGDMRAMDRPQIDGPTEHSDETFNGGGLSSEDLSKMVIDLE